MGTAGKCQDSSVLPGVRHIDSRIVSIPGCVARRPRDQPKPKLDVPATPDENRDPTRGSAVTVKGSTAVIGGNVETVQRALITRSSTLSSSRC